MPPPWTFINTYKRIKEIRTKQNYPWKGLKANNLSGDA